MTQSKKELFACVGFGVGGDVGLKALDIFTTEGQGVDGKHFVVVGDSWYTKKGKRIWCDLINKKYSDEFILMNGGLE